MKHFKRIHHFALSVPDLEESIRWYADMLDFRLERRFGFPDFDVEIAHLLSESGIRIELLYQKGSVPGPDAGRDAFKAIATQGAKHIGLQVDDIEAVAELLKQKRVTVLHELTTVEAAGVRNFWILDNAGNQLEINQPLYQ